MSTKNKPLDGLFAQLQDIKASSRTSRMPMAS